MDRALNLSEKRAEKEALSLKNIVIRSPCDDAHYEAFILQSRWTVGNLYASNLNLAHLYMKKVADMEKQRKVWLKREETEQKKMLDRMERLIKEQQNKKSFVLTNSDRKQFNNSVARTRYKLQLYSSPAEIEQLTLSHEGLEPSLAENSTIQRKLRIRPLSELAFPALKSEDVDTKYLSKQMPDCRSFLSPRIRSETVPVGRDRKMSFITSAAPPLRQRSISFGHNQVRKYFTTRSKILRDDDELIADPNIKPKWLPTMVRSQTKEKILFELF